MIILYVVLVLAALHIVAVWFEALRSGLALAVHQPTRSDAPASQSRLISIIIPAWNERGTLERCLASLRLIDYPAWEVIVIAGGPDGTLQAAVQACKTLEHARVVEQLPRGLSAALNQGLGAARGDIIVFLDADSLVPHEWLRELVQPLQGQIQVTTGNPLPLHLTPISITEQMENLAAREIQHRVILQGCGSIALDRQVIQELGFSENVRVGVDWDLSARLAQRGVMIGYCPRALVRTERPSSLREFWRNELRWRRAHLSSLFRLNGYFLRDVRSIVKNLYFYALSWFAVMFTVAVLVFIGSGAPDLRIRAVFLWITFVVWLALRRAALAVQVAAYTHEVRWLRYLAVPPILLFISLIAAWLASLSLSRINMHFKGPRRLMEKSA